MNRFLRSLATPALTMPLWWAWLGGCADEAVPSGRAPESEAGSVGIALSVGTTSLDSLRYVIENGDHSYKGTIALLGASLVSKVVGAIEAGPGYQLTLTGTTAGDAGFACTGTVGPFVVPPRSTASVSIAIRCTRPSTLGGVMVGGTVNLCPFIATMAADPPANGSIALHGTAEDLDGLPRPLTYAWTASPGSLTSANLANATLRCTQTGVVNVQLSVSDGDPECTDSLSLQVDCGPGAVAPATPAVPARDAGAVVVDASAPRRDASSPAVDAVADAADADADAGERASLADGNAADAEAGAANADSGAAADADAEPSACLQTLTPFAQRGAALCSGCVPVLLPPRVNADGSCVVLPADAGVPGDECGCAGRTCEAGTCSLQYVGRGGADNAPVYRNACTIPECDRDQDCGPAKICIPALGIAQHTAPRCVPAGCLSAKDCSETGCVSCELVVTTTAQGETSITGSACARGR